MSRHDSSQTQDVDSNDDSPSVSQNQDPSEPVLSAEQWLRKNIFAGVPTSSPSPSPPPYKASASEPASPMQERRETSRERKKRVKKMKKREKREKAKREKGSKFKKNKKKRHKDHSPSVEKKKKRAKTSHLPSPSPRHRSRSTSHYGSRSRSRSSRISQLEGSRSPLGHRGGWESRRSEERQRGHYDEPRLGAYGDQGFLAEPVQRNRLYSDDIPRSGLPYKSERIADFPLDFDHEKDFGHDPNNRALRPLHNRESLLTEPVYRESRASSLGAYHSPRFRDDFDGRHRHFDQQLLRERDYKSYRDLDPELGRQLELELERNFALERAREDLERKEQMLMEHERREHFQMDWERGEMERHRRHEELRDRDFRERERDRVLMDVRRRGEHVRQEEHLWRGPEPNNGRQLHMDREPRDRRLALERGSRGSGSSLQHRGAYREPGPSRMRQAGGYPKRGLARTGASKGSTGGHGTGAGADAADAARGIRSGNAVPSSGQNFHTNPRHGTAPADEFDDLLKEHTTQQTLRPEPKKAADMSFEELLGI